MYFWYILPEKTIPIRKLIFLAYLLFFSLGGSLFAQSSDFTVGATIGCAPHTFNFSDQSSPTPMAWSWDFGDGNTSTSKDPSNTYYTAGVYTVKLEVTFAGGGKITTTKTDYITVYKKPTANFTATNTSGCEDLPVSFTNQSTQGSGSIKSYFYDFGNTFSDTVQNPTHIYRTDGVFDVKLVIEDVNGCQDVKEIKTLVNVLPIPTANFTTGQQIGCSYPHQVTYINTTTANTTGSLTYAWDFGNGNYSTVRAPTTVYQAPSNYNVRLIATNALGCKDTAFKNSYIKVEVPKASFNSSSVVGCPPLMANFSNTSQPAGGNFKWSFGSVASSISADTSVVFNNSGNYTVKLVFTSPNGCKDSIIKTNHVQVSQRRMQSLARMILQAAGRHIRLTSPHLAPQGPHGNGYLATVPSPHNATPKKSIWIPGNLRFH